MTGLRMSDRKCIGFGAHREQSLSASVSLFYELSFNVLRLDGSFFVKLDNFYL